MTRKSVSLLRQLRNHFLAAPLQPPPGASSHQLVVHAYRRVLGREPDEAGHEHWTKFLNTGGTYDELVQAFLRSPEFRARLQEPFAVAAPSIARRPQADGASPYAVIGNGQAFSMARCIEALTDTPLPAWRWVSPATLSEETARDDLVGVFDEHDKVFIQPALWETVTRRFPELTQLGRRRKCVLFPSVTFAAFHPDLAFVALPGGSTLRGVTGEYHSSVALMAWKAGLDAAAALKLYNGETYRRLGFLGWWQPAVTMLLDEGRAAGLPIEGLLERWTRAGCFMHAVDHPKLFVIADIARALLQREEIACAELDPTASLRDALQDDVVWPLYPEIGERLQLAGDYRFKLESYGVSEDAAPTLDLEQFVDRSFALYQHYGPDDLRCDRFEHPVYADFLGELRSPARATRPRTSTPTAPRRVASSESTIAVLGNCQAGQMARCVQALTGGPMPRQEWVTPERVAEWQAGRGDFERFFEHYAHVFAQPWIWTPLASRYAQFADRVVLYPSIGFMAYHPDLVPIVRRSTGAAFDEGPIHRCNSALAFLGWVAGLDVTATVALFREDVFRRLGYFDFWASSEAVLLEEGRAANLPLDDLLAKWRRAGCFMHCHVHPKLAALADVAGELLRRRGIPLAPGNPLEYAHDYLANGPAWPVYPEIARALGIEGSYAFKRGSELYSPDLPVQMLDLPTFVRESFAAYDEAGKDELVCQRLTLPSYQALIDELRQAPSLAPPSKSAAPSVVEREDLATMFTIATRKAAHPYAALPAHQRWRSAVTEVAAADVDPVIATKFRIDMATRIATAGSCFAQRISEALRGRGMRFLQSELPPQAMPAEEAERLEYGTFSARFGFIYTARQLRQLFERAFGTFVPLEQAWLREDGRYVDPFRPRVDPDGFASAHAVATARDAHLASVRRMFEMLDVFVFTLGLTEAWRDRRDGAVFPLAPGVAGGAFQPDRHEFVNFEVAEVDADLTSFLQQLAAVNPKARVILTVSPIPLAATAEPEHVLSASTYSKAVLRVAAGQVARRSAACDYFPAYEIVAGSFHRGRYVADDLRSVTPEGVEHILRVFFGHYAQSALTPADASRLAEARRNIARVCDEDYAAAVAGS
jgi:hypothetical protein